MGETRNREYFSRKCRRKSIELCHCQIQRRSSMKAVIILLLNLSESELIRDGKKWAASRNHCYCWCLFLHQVLSKVVNINISHKENQWQFVSIFWTNIYAVKILLYMKNSSSPVIICSFQVLFPHQQQHRSCPSYLAISSPLYKHSVSSTSLQVWYFMHLNVLETFDSSVPM